MINEFFISLHKHAVVFVAEVNSWDVVDFLFGERLTEFRVETPGVVVDAVIPILTVARILPVINETKLHVAGVVLIFRQVFRIILVVLQLHKRASLLLAENWRVHNVRIGRLNSAIFLPLAGKMVLTALLLSVVSLVVLVEEAIVVAFRGELGVVQLLVVVSDALNVLRSISNLRVERLDGAVLILLAGELILTASSLGTEADPACWDGHKPE